MLEKIVDRKLLPALALSLATVVIFFLIPPPHFDRPCSTLVLDRHGQLLSASIAEDQQWRFPEITSVPEKYQKAALTFEDRRFFYHPGVDLLALARAARDNLARGRVVSGASTITMQVVRLSRPNKPRTVTEKVVEMILALRLEMTKNKKDILKLYASHAPYGGNVVGLEAAAWRYFGARPQDLSWAETAMLAVLPNSPSLIHPGRNRQKLLAKRDALLRSLLQRGILDSLSCSLAVQEPLPDKPRPLPMSAPHLLQRCRAQSGHDQNRFHTTLDGALQRRVSDIIERRHGRLLANQIHNAAALVLDIETLKVLAYVGNVGGGVDSTNSHYVDIITSPRSTGSILKPFLYAAMLEAGELLPTAIVPDIPMQIGGFAPQNFTRTYEGAVPACQALAHSLNVPAVRMLRDYGVHRFYGLLQQLGMTTLHRPAHEYGLSLILGGAEGTLWDLTAMYAGLVRSLLFESTETKQKPFCTPVYLDSESFEAQSVHSPLSAASCWLTLQAMLEVSRPEEDQAWREFHSSQKIAWKTGTSFGYRDGWAIGLTPKFAVGVWVGNADGEGRPGLTGLSVAAPILFDIFNTVEWSAWFAPPAGQLYEISVCAKSGFRAGPYCATTAALGVPQAGASFSTCPYCHLVCCDSTQTWRVHS
ncbi:penicillin-binding protein 1C, partial [candidate division KSB1 bacterium]|nr:penicillin-binding protein 1C [candidate division KSB1 bacterium]